MHYMPDLILTFSFAVASPRGLTYDLLEFWFSNFYRLFDTVFFWPTFVTPLSRRRGRVTLSPVIRRPVITVCSSRGYRTCARTCFSVFDVLAKRCRQPTTIIRIICRFARTRPQRYPFVVRCTRPSDLTPGHNERKSNRSRCTPGARRCCRHPPGPWRTLCARFARKSDTATSTAWTRPKRCRPTEATWRATRSVRRDLSSCRPRWR